MIRATVLVGVLCAALGCSGGHTDGAAPEPDCDSELIWKGVAYGGIDTSAPPELGTRLGRATIPACGPSVPERRVDVAAIRGVAPPVALVSPAYDRDLVWLGSGYLASSPQHPLHDVVEHAVGGWDAERGFRCKAPITLTAQARRTPGALDGYVEVSAAEAEWETFLMEGDVRGIVSLDDDMVVTDLRRHDIPFVRTGDVFELTISECEGRETEPGLAGLRLLVVREMRPEVPNR